MNNKIIFGGLYQANEKISYIIPKYNDSLNDQKLNLWIPVRTTYFDKVDNKEVDRIYLIDTYQLDIPYEYQNNYDNVVSWLKSLSEPKDHRHVAFNAYNYYYTALVQVTEDTIKAFDFIADLANYKPVTQEEKRYYNDGDYLGKIYLSNYHHAYNKPFYLVKKSAEFRHDLKVSNLVWDARYNIRAPHFPTWDYNKVLDAVEDAEKQNAYYNKDEVTYIKLLKEKVDALCQEYEEYHREIRQRYIRETGETPAESNKGDLK